MKTIRQTIATLLIAICATGAMAQTATSSYFLEGAFHNYKLNPAMQPERAYFSLGAGNISLRLNGNVGISNFLFPNGDNLTTFMSSNVSSDEFLNALPDNARIGFNYEQDIFDFGFRMLGGYTSFGMSLHSSMSMLMPKGLFEFAKMGLQNENYNFAGLNLNTMNYAAITLGHSREIIKGLSVGLNLKYLAGLAYANLSVDKLNVELNDKHWMVNSHASAQAAFLCQAEPMFNEDGAVNGVDFMAKSSSSSGFAADLGVVYNMNHFVPGLTVSASVTNLGAIKWNNMMNVESNDAAVEFDGFGSIDYNDMEASVEDELERLTDDAKKMIEFNYTGSEAFTTKLSPTMYLGAEYNMPFYDKLSVALLYSQRFSKFDYNKYYDVRGYVNIAPLSWIEATVNYGVSTYGSTLGWMLNIHPAGFNLFVGSDFMISKVTPQYIPVDDLNAHVTFGIGFPIGSKTKKNKN